MILEADLEVQEDLDHDPDPQLTPLTPLFTLIPLGGLIGKMQAFKRYDLFALNTM